LTKGRITADHRRSWMVQSYSLPIITYFLVHTWVHAPNGISIGSAVFFHNSSKQNVPILYFGPPLSSENCPCAWDRSGHPSSHACLGPLHSASQTASRSVQPFLHRVPILYNKSPFSPPKLPIHNGDRDLHLIDDSLHPSEPQNPNGISISSAVFAGLTTVTDRPTVCNNRPHLRT